MASNLDTLKEKIEEARASLDQIDPEWEADDASEGLNGRELRQTVMTILDDLSRLCRGDHLKFYFSNGEVNHIASQLGNLVAHLGSPAQIVASLTAIRPHIRSYLIRGTAQDRAEKIAEIEEKLQVVDAYLREREDLARMRTELEECLETAEDSLGSIQEHIEKLKELQTSAEGHHEAAKTAAEGAAEEKASAESDRESVDSFVEKIAQRETQLENQTARTVAFEKRLDELKAAYDADKKTRDQRLKESEATLNSIIAQAREALELNTALGLSKEFGERAKSLRPGLGFRLGRSFPFFQKDNGALLWIFAAGAFVTTAGLITLLLATNLLELTFGSENSTITGVSPINQGDWFGLLSRLSVVGISITAAVFCANQYRRNQKLFEDYSYKKVVAASLHAFMEKLAEIEETDSLTATFLRKALDEIFCHPLREDSRTEPATKSDSDLPISAIQKIVHEVISAQTGKTSTK